MESDFLPLTMEVVQQLRQLGYVYLVGDVYTVLDGDEVIGPGAALYYAEMVFRQAIPVSADEAVDEDDCSWVSLDLTPKLIALVNDEVNWYHVHKKYVTKPD